MTRFFLAAASAILASACISTRLEHPPLIPSQVNERLAEFDGRVVRIRGYLVVTPHAWSLLESKAIQREMRSKYGSKGFNPRDWEKYCLTVINVYDRRLDLFALNGHTVEVLARVDKEHGAEGIDLGACAIDTGIEIIQVKRVVG